MAEKTTRRSISKLCKKMKPKQLLHRFTSVNGLDCLGESMEMCRYDGPTLSSCAFGEGSTDSAASGTASVAAAAGHVSTSPADEGVYMDMCQSLREKVLNGAIFANFDENSQQPTTPLAMQALIAHDMPTPTEPSTSPIPGKSYFIYEYMCVYIYIFPNTCK